MLQGFLGILLGQNAIERLEPPKIDAESERADNTLLIFGVVASIFIVAVIYFILNSRK